MLLVLNKTRINTSVIMIRCKKLIMLSASVINNKIVNINSSSNSSNKDNMNSTTSSNLRLPYVKRNKKFIATTMRVAITSSVNE